jgi:quercetin dioxygenase-like cupin family protein
MIRRRASFFLGMLAGAGLMAAVPQTVGWTTRVWAAQSSGEPKYPIKVVLENARVRVRDVTFPPGVLDTGMHTHEYPHVGVILTEGSLVFTEPGKAGETVKFDVGSVGFREANVTHQVANPGRTPMRVIEVELK